MPAPRGVDARAREKIYPARRLMAAVTATVTVAGLAGGVSLVHLRAANLARRHMSRRRPAAPRAMRVPPPPVPANHAPHGKRGGQHDCQQEGRSAIGHIR
jgi:hypothetical protein